MALPKFLNGSPEKSVHDPFLAYPLVALKTSKKTDNVEVLRILLQLQGTPLNS
jgi:hypothetical protein